MRRGFTLVEVLVAMVILSGVCLSLAQFMSPFVRNVNQATVRSIATEVALEQINLVKADPSYTTLATVWAGTRSGFPSYPSMARVTTLRRVTGNSPTRDYTIITVLVSDPALPAGVTLNATVAAP
jgi:prepilin-type N-terminal cleavage/methylation domain-containing protein